MSDRFFNDVLTAVEFAAAATLIATGFGEAAWPIFLKTFASSNVLESQSRSLPDEGRPP